MLIVSQMDVNFYGQFSLVNQYLLDKNIFFKVLIGVFFIKQVVDHINVKVFDKMDNGICMGFDVIQGGFILLHFINFFESRTVCIQFP